MDNPSSSIQHAQMIQVATGLTAALATMLLTLAGRWIGGGWTTLVATLLAVLLAFHPLIHAALFSNIKTDRLQMILLAMIPFTLILIGLSFVKKARPLNILFALIGPPLLLTWVFHDYAVQTIPRQTLLLHQIIPLSLAVFAFWALIEPIAVRSPGLAAPMVVALLATACTFLLMLSAENNAGLMATPIAGAAGGATVAALIFTFIGKKNLSLARGPVLLWLTVLGSMFAFLWISSDQLPLSDLYWLASVPLLAWVPEIGPIHRFKPWKRESIRLVLITIPVVTAMLLAFKAHQRDAAAAGDPFGINWPQPAAPMCPSQMPIPNTINPPTIT